jgi:hypothetical protein
LGRHKSIGPKHLRNGSGSTARHFEQPLEWMEFLQSHPIPYILFYRLLFIVSSSIFLGILLLKRFNKAIVMSTKQTDVFSQLSATFSSETTNKWEELVANWNADPKALNPYQEPKNSMWRLSDILHLGN